MRQLTPLKAIRLHCLDCCCGQSKEVRLCPATDCSLHGFRLGKNPNIKPRDYTPEERESMRARLSKKPLIKDKQKLTNNSITYTSPW